MQDRRGTFAANFARGAAVAALAITGIVVWGAQSVDAAPPTTFVGQIRPKHNTGLCLTSTSTSNGDKVRFQSCTSHSKHDWYIEELDQRVYRLRNSWSGKCLEIENQNLATGLRYEQRACEPSSQPNDWEQHFVTIKTGDDGTWQLRTGYKGYTPAPSHGPNKDTQRWCAEVPGSGGSGSLLKIWECGISSILQTNQRFEFEYQPNEWSAGDGQITSLQFVSPQIGMISSSGTSGWCTASAANGPGSRKDIGVTAGHCLDDWQPGHLRFFRPGFDERRPGLAELDTYLITDVVWFNDGSRDVAWFSTDPVTTTTELHDRVGKLFPQFGHLNTGGEMLFSYGYPYNVGRKWQLHQSDYQVACAAPRNALPQWPNDVATECHFRNGSSGAPWSYWGTSNLIGVNRASSVNVASTSSIGGFILNPDISRFRPFGGIELNLWNTIGGLA